MKKTGKRLLSAFVSLVMLSSWGPGFLTTVSATTTVAADWAYSDQLEVSQDEIVDNPASGNSEAFASKGSATWNASINAITARVVAENTNTAQCTSIITLTNKTNSQFDISLSARLSAHDPSGQPFYVWYDGIAQYSFDDVASDEEDLTYIFPTTYTKTMQPNDTLTIQVQSPMQSGSATTYTEVTIDVILSGLDSSSVEFPAVSNGTYTVNGTAVGNDGYGYDPSVHGTTIELRATVNDGTKYQFEAWRDQNGKILSETTEATIDLSTLSECTKIYPTFINASAEKVFQVVNGNAYFTWEDAFSKAGASGTVKLIGSTVAGNVGKYTLPDYTDMLAYGYEDRSMDYVDVDTENETVTYEIGSGQTFLIPHVDSGATDISYTEAETDFDYGYYTLTATTTAGDLARADSYRYRQLSVPRKVTIENAGILKVGGQITAKSASTMAGSTYRLYGEIYLDGTISVVGSGVLSACGYVVGDGNVEATGTDAKICSPMTIIDYRGGTFCGTAIDPTNTVTDKVSGERSISPFTQYTMQNIQTDVEIHQGNRLMAYCNLATGDGHNSTTTCIVGDATDSNKAGLINLSAGAVFTAEYASEDHLTSVYTVVGKTYITIRGGAAFGSMDLNAADVATVHTSSLVFPLPYNYDITLENGSYQIGYSLGILPGATLTVAEDAYLSIVGSSTIRFMIYDGLYDHTRSAGTATYGTQASMSYPTTARLQESGYSNGTGNVIINGTLHIGNKANIGGLIQTTSEGSRIIMDSGAVASCSTQVGLFGRLYLKLTNLYGVGGATYRSLNAQIFTSDSDETTPTQLVPGRTYYGRRSSDDLSAYEFNFYPGTGSLSWSGLKYNVSQKKENLNANVAGHWTTDTANVKIVNGANAGKTYVSISAALADYSNADNSYIEILHDYPEDVTTAINEDVYVDLNGHNIRVLKNYLVGTLDFDGSSSFYGIDTTTNDYTATADTAGKIIGEVSGVQSFTTTDRVAGVSRTHIPVTTGTGSEKTTSFYRASVAVTGAQFVRDGETVYIVFRGGLRANDEAVINGVDAGFKVGTKTVTWFNSDKTSTKDPITASDILAELQNQEDTIFDFYYGSTPSEMPADVIAVAKLNGAAFESKAVTSSEIRALLDAFPNQLKEAAE